VLWELWELGLMVVIELTGLIKLTQVIHFSGSLFFSAWIVASVVVALFRAPKHGFYMSFSLASLLI